MKEEKNIEPTLSGLPKGNPFKTPEGYFENLQDRIEAKIEAEAENIPGKTKAIRLLRPALSLAASFALIFLLVYYPLNKFLPKYLNSEQVVENNEFDIEDDFIYSLSNDHSLIEYFSESNDETEPSDEIYAYLSVKMTDAEFYNELIKN